MRQRGRHRAPVRARGWAPRALLSAATVPIGVALGLGAAVVSAVLDRPGLAVVGVALAGAPGLFHAARATVLDRELRGRHSAATIPATGLAADDEERHVLAQLAGVSSENVPVVQSLSVEEETGELQRIWDLGDGPDTGPQPTVPADAALLQPPVTVDLTDHALVPVAFAAKAAPARRPRVGTTEARVYDALAHAEADELTRTLEMPSRRGRHAAEAVYDAPPRTGPSMAIAQPRTIAPRKGRHAA